MIRNDQHTLDLLPHLRSTNSETANIRLNLHRQIRIGNTACNYQISEMRYTSIDDTYRPP